MLCTDQQKSFARQNPRDDWYELGRAHLIVVLKFGGSSILGEVQKICDHLIQRIIRVGEIC